MAIQKDVEVRIARNTSKEIKSNTAGDDLPEYEKPNSSSNPAQNSVERYVEAVTGQAFQVEVYIKPGFKFYGADGLTIRLMLDDKTVNKNLWFPRALVEQQQRAGQPLIISSTPHADGARFLNVGFIFGSLHLGEPHLYG